MAGRWRFGAPLLGLCLGLGGLGCGRDRPPAGVSEQSELRVFLPTRLGWVSSARASGALPSAVALGGKASGRVLLYIEFPAVDSSRRLLRAQLVLSAAGTPGASIGAELSRAEPPAHELRNWSDQPRARYPRLLATLVNDGVPARLDVTEIVRAETKPGEPLRLLLRAEPDSAEPLFVETGAAGGAAPRLEVYWQ